MELHCICYVSVRKVTQLVEGDSWGQASSDDFPSDTAKDASFHRATTDVRGCEHVVGPRPQPGGNGQAPSTLSRFLAQRPGVGAVPAPGPGSRVGPLSSLLPRRPGAAATLADLVKRPGQGTATATPTPAESVLLLGRAPRASPSRRHDNAASGRTADASPSPEPPRPQKGPQTVPHSVRQLAVVAIEQHGGFRGRKAAVVDGRASGKSEAA